jgi:hypothetical protein
MRLPITGLMERHFSFYYYNKIKGNSVHKVTCFLGFEQRSNSIIKSVLLDFVFSNISGLSACISSPPVVGPDTNISIASSRFQFDF